MKSNYQYIVSYFQHAGYVIAIDANAPIERIIDSVQVFAESRLDALRAAIAKFVERGVLPVSTANMYLKSLKRGSKHVRIACANG